MKPEGKTDSDRVLRMMKTIFGALASEFGPKLDLEIIALWTGEARSTVLDRFNRARQSQIEGLLRLLERLPTKVRGSILEQFLKQYPSLGDRRLNHNPAQVASLRWLLGKRQGTTVVFGGNSADRTYVVAALAREAGTGVQGLDSHHQSWFVGAPSIRYIDAILPTTQLAENVKLDLPGPLVLFNGIYLKMPPDMHPKIRAYAKNRHLILADEFESFRAGDWLRPVHTVRLSSSGNESIHAMVEAA